MAVLCFPHCHARALPSLEIGIHGVGDAVLLRVQAPTRPDFDPSVRAFYDARAVEIPTPRWTAYDAARFGIKLPPEVPMTVQERAWASPIWHTPAK